ncbi:MAG: hypothetical protein ACT4OF_14345, partial [Caulobacteraceae bacterium]
MSPVRSRLLSTSILRPIMSALLLGFVALSATPSFAQDVEEEEAIVVTGTRIRSPLSEDEPITNIGQEEIARTGLSSTADILQRVPLSGGGLNTRFNQSGNFGNPPDGGGVGAGAAEIDLRYLLEFNRSSQHHLDTSFVAASKASAGVRQPSVFLGLALSAAATA